MWGLIPFPYNYIALAAVAVALTVGGFVTGIEWEQGRQAQEMVAVKDRIIERTKVITKQDNTAIAEAQAKNAALRAVNEQLQLEVNRHATTLPDPPECRIHPDRVRTIQRAWGALSADSAGGKAPVLGSDGRPVPDFGQSQRGGGLGSQVGAQVPGVPGR